MAKEPKHHYIPIFYLQQRTGTTGELVEYCRRYKGVVVPRPTFPDGTGYVRGLYTLPGAPAGHEQIIETKLMGTVDNWASKALARMMEDAYEPGRLDPREAVGWCQFIYSLVVRNPEHLLLIKQKLSEMSPEVLEHARDDYEKLRGRDDPPTFDEYKKNFSYSRIDVPPPRVLLNIITSKRVTLALASMRWLTANVGTAKHALLTSDRPIIMTNGLDRSDAHIVLPVSPHRLAIAAKEERTLQEITSRSADELVCLTNSIVCDQAYKFVYGVDASQLRFVANRLGNRIKSSPLG